MSKKQPLLLRIVRKRIFLMVLLTLVFVVFFAILSEGFTLTRRNIINIVSSMAITTFLTTGAAFLLISGKLDLSMGATGTLCGMILAYVMRAGLPLIPSIILTLVAGAFVGLINAALVNELHIAPFIATIATSTIATGFVYILGQRKTIDITNQTLINYGKNTLFEIMPICSLVAIVCMVVAGIVLHKTTFGRKIYSVGGNPEASMLSGINPRKVTYALFITCGIFASMAGITFVARMQSANLQGILSSRFNGIIAAILGGIALGGGSGGMVGAFVGLLIISVFNNGMNAIGIGPNWQNIASGLLLIFALALDYIQKKQRLKVVV